MRRYCAHESGHLPCRRLPGEAEEDDGGLVLYRRAGESYSCFDSLHKGDQICLLTMLLPPSSFRSLLFMSPLPSAPRTKAIDLQIGLEHASIDAPGPKRLNRHLRLDTLRPTLSCRHDRSAHFDQHTSTNALRPTHFDQHIPINTLRSTHSDQHTSISTPRPTHFDQHTSINTFRSTHSDQHTSINTLRSAHLDQRNSTKTNTRLSNCSWRRRPPDVQSPFQHSQSLIDSKKKITRRQSTNPRTHFHLQKGKSLEAMNMSTAM
jgi:hypothetical protein